MENVIPAEETIGMLAATHAAFRAVFEELGIDYYCTGNLSLDEAAQAAGIDPGFLRRAMERVAGKDRGPNWVDRPLHALIDHLASGHHKLLRDSLVGLALQLDEAHRHSDDAHLTRLRERFREFSERVRQHVDREESALFPIAVSLDDAWMRRQPLVAARGDVRALIGQLLVEHGTIAGQLEELAMLRKRISATAVENIRKAMETVDTVEAQMHAYLNLENQVVFPRVLALLEETSPVEVS